MLKQYDTKVMCRIDGTQKTFYYTLIEEPGKPLRFGIRHGCNDKRGCADCVKCWQELKSQSSLK